jgi:hypothetical protein
MGPDCAHLEEDPCEFPQCGGATTTAPPGTTGIVTTVAPVSTSAVPGTCQSPPKDIFVAIDASKSVKQNGWDVQMQAALQLVNGILGGGNPKGHRMNVHWFNGITSPITAAANIKEPTGKVHSKQASQPSPNDIGTFVGDAGVITAAIGQLVYDDLVFGATDHPQVYLTAAHAFANNPTENERLTILITDGETHSGQGCGNDLPSDNDVSALIGDCSTDQNHPCRRGADSGQVSCDHEKCICGMYKAEVYKADGLKATPPWNLIVVGIANGQQGTTFQDQMVRMASTNKFFFAEDFDALSGIVANVVGDVCTR